MDEFDDGQADQDRVLAEYEWYWPAAILAVGLVVCFVGGIGAGGAVGLVQTVGILILGLAVSIPVAVAALMAVGMVIGINYGRLGPAVLKLAAIICVANGIMLLGAWRGLPFFVYCPVSCIITFGLFMTQFELDHWEANLSVGAINLLSFVANVVLVVFLTGGLAKSDGGGDEFREEGGDGDEPALVAPGEEFRRDRDMLGKTRPAKPKAAKKRPVDPDDDGPDDE